VGGDPESWRQFRDAVRAHFAREIEREARESSARRAAVKARLDEGLRRARAEGLLGRAWLFGSYAWGEPGERSDVDLLVEGCADPMLVATVVGGATRTDVHVITVEEAPASLADRARGEGVEV
jgi:predicted nucleotidyltransferase